VNAAPLDILGRIELADEAATARLAAALAAAARPGDCFALAGPLGSGKTSLARSFIRSLGDPDEEVPSPTFTLVQTYEMAAFTLWHFDLYRLSRPEDAIELGFDEALAEGVVLVEWPERLGPLLPAARLDIALSPGATPGARRAVLGGGAAWRARLAGLALASLADG
jgi:tRNA threonylcarbamoyladenosine biosynthesis protein TsaE